MYRDALSPHPDRARYRSARSTLSHKGRGKRARCSQKTKPLRLAGTIRGMKMSETRELYNRRARKRLDRALPNIFPKPVLIHALSRRWTPTLPRLAVDAYWRAHAIRADRLARALAAQSGAPIGWTWRVGSDEGLPRGFEGPRAQTRQRRGAVHLLVIREPEAGVLEGRPPRRVTFPIKLFGWRSVGPASIMIGL